MLQVTCPVNFLSARKKILGSKKLTTQITLTWMFFVGVVPNSAVADTYMRCGEMRSNVYLCFDAHLASEPYVWGTIPFGLGRVVPILNSSEGQFFCNPVYPDPGGSQALVDGQVTVNHPAASGVRLEYHSAIVVCRSPPPPPPPPPPRLVFDIGSSKNSKLKLCLLRIGLGLQGQVDVGGPQHDRMRTCIALYDFGNEIVSPPNYE